MTEWELGPAPDGRVGVLVPLRKRGGGMHGYAVIDVQDESLAQHSWSKTGRGNYAYRWDRSSGRRRLVLLHRAVLGFGPGDPQVDHIDGDHLNCRRSNLRPATQLENGQNIVRSGGASRYRGVSRTRDGKRWRARVKLRGVEHALGVFDDEHAAADAARNFRLLHMPYSNEERTP